VNQYININSELDALKNEFGTVLDYSFARVMMVGEGYVESLLGKKKRKKKHHRICKVQ